MNILTGRYYSFEAGSYFTSSLLKDVFSQPILSLFLSFSVIADQILKLFAKKYLFFNSLAGKLLLVFDSLTSDALVSSKNTKSVCKVRRKLMKTAVPDHVPVKDVIRLGDIGLLKKTLG